jgi:urease accessory protein
MTDLAPPQDQASARLLLTQLLSPAFPIGSYAYSQGMEVAMVAGEVRDAASLEAWILGVLRHGSARIDLALLTRARAPGADLHALADLAYAYAPARERAEELRDQGAAFAACARALGLATPDLPYPVALGAATAALPLSDAEVAALYLQALAAQLISAAVRFLPLGATEGQKLLARLGPLLPRLAQAPQSLTSGHLAGDLAAMAHETLQPRIFRS